MPTNADRINVPVIAAEVCQHLGLGWHVLAEIEQRNWFANIADDTGLVLSLMDNDVGPKGRRLHISAPTVHSDNGYCFNDRSRPAPAITVAQTSTPKAIASHITRRLLDQASDYWTRAQEWKQVIEAEAARTQALAATFAQYPSALRGHDSANAIYGRGWRIQIHSPTSASLQFASIHPAAARSILDAFHAKPAQ